MPSLEQTSALLESKAFTALLEEMYGQDPEVTKAQRARYADLLNEYASRFGESDVFLFSSPGRTEISGNHTDHNLGKIVAASINMDCIGVASRRSDGKVGIVSLDYNEDFTLDLANRADVPGASGTYTLVLGILEGFEKKGFRIGGFNVCLTSDVISAAGVSSSASFEMLICAIVNSFYNEGALSVVDCAKIGQYAENHKWDKQSGLLDQMACGHGGLISIDFRDAANPAISSVDFQAINRDYTLLIVPTGGNHADLSAEYSSIPSEMKAVAGVLGAQVLGELREEDVLARIPEIREKAGDRALMRALHFFEENRRVDGIIAALAEGDAQAFLRLITESGNSSWKWLQNIYASSAPDEQGVSVHLALTELFLRNHGGVGATRVHGGGFAGVILTVLPHALVEEYKAYLASFGMNQTYTIRMRPYGSVNLNGLLKD
ncbi:galactokinase [Paenibacillus glufosinatiresistens]|uniref:galactokinase n=1 Tax=Paenibacillus glufosinatiresistens TaxID=3070657 RepID=UPI00286D9010|nr:galactokinase family protein [Paenibacillus sp. YX.27]